MPCIEIQRLRAYTPPDDVYGTEKRAAVLVGLVVDPETRRLEVWLTLRSSELRKHGGEVALPGGRQEGSDADLVATALRESEEEIGLDRDAVESVTCLKPFLSRFLLLVTPVVGIVPSDFVPAANPDEVAACFKIPLEEFLSNENHSSTDEMIPRAGLWRRHEFHWRNGDGETYKIFGLTADILIHCATLAYQRHPDFRITAQGQPSLDELIQRLDFLGYFRPKL
ncbi:NUDIX hydrolase domain-like protein [Geranomyces variabilis]|nr:NUDIX hydrolase domain-like protein [Geranomyces variabilis]KAJ3139905.1 hypothetical protein HDU90_008804 [Geranomyces variabilis]